jgi:hypothetical protein
MQLQNLQNPMSVVGQNQPLDQMQQMQNSFSQIDPNQQNQNSITSQGGNGFGQPTMGAFSGGAEALMNILQQLLLQQQQITNFGNGQATSPFGQVPPLNSNQPQQQQMQSNNPLMALLSGLGAGVPTNSLPPPIPNPFGNGPNLATNNQPAFGLVQPPQPDSQLNGSTANGQQANQVGGTNPQQPLQFSGMENGSSINNLGGNQGLGLMNGK